MKRYTKAQAQYKDYSRENKCMHCVYFKKPNKCRIVIGKISPNGSSNYWRKR